MAISLQVKGLFRSNLNRERVIQWQKKIVFFLTPQVMQNDLARGSCPANDVTCIVFDEAHKALGNHAYCQVISDDDLKPLLF